MHLSSLASCHCDKFLRAPSEEEEGHPGVVTWSVHAHLAAWGPESDSPECVFKKWRFPHRELGGESAESTGMRI